MARPAAPLTPLRSIRPSRTSDRGRHRPVARLGSEPVRLRETGRERLVVVLLWGTAVLVMGAWAALIALVVRWLA